MGFHFSSSLPANKKFATDTSLALFQSLVVASNFFAEAINDGTSAGRNRNENWFQKVVTHPYWHQMSSDGLPLTPAELASETAKHPDEFELYLSHSSFVNYDHVYQNLKLPALLIYGSGDQLVPIQQSRTMIETALRRIGSKFEVKIFEGADHTIQTADEHVRQDYLDFMVAWANAHFGRD